MNLCDFEINENAMIDSHILCDENVSECNVQIKSKLNQLTLKNTTFEWYVYIHTMQNYFNFADSKTVETMQDAK